MKRQVAAVVGGQSQIGFVKEKIMVHLYCPPSTKLGGGHRVIILNSHPCSFQSLKMFRF